ncbi:hypothetical protein PHLH6_21230 [Pseudomonas sp. Seg1]|nr:hypothetical protein PHLH6_21230 [Pseudomonas sp. Seg1]
MRVRSTLDATPVKIASSSQHKKPCFPWRHGFFLYLSTQLIEMKYAIYCSSSLLAVSLVKSL